MFRVTMLVDDKKLAAAMHALNGLAYNLEVNPIAVTTDANGVKKPRTNNNVIGDLKPHLKKGMKLTNSKMGEMLGKIGYSPVSSSYTLAKLVKGKIIKKSGKAEYEVL